MRLTKPACYAALLMLALAGAPAAAALRTVGAVARSLPLDGGVELRMASGARVRVGFATPDAVRVRMHPAGQPGFAPEGASWLGGGWAPTNYMVSRGLLRYGRHALAARLARRY